MYMQNYYNVIELVSKYKHVISGDGTDRAVSVAVDHVLGLFILLLITGVFVSGVSSSFGERQEMVTEKELERITDEVANSLVQADATVEYAQRKDSSPSPATDVEIESRVLVPSLLSHQGYSVTIGNNGDEVVVTGLSGDVEVEQEITLENNVEEFGGSGVFIIGYDGNQLTVEGG